MNSIKNHRLKKWVLVLTVLFTGCDDYLSELPDNRTLLDSPAKISNLLVRAYPHGNYMPFTESMSDNADDKGTWGSLTSTGARTINSLAYAWETITSEIDQDSPINYWESCYGAIAHANHALEAIEKLEGGDRLDPQKGEALLARAYAHFMLVNLWAKHYNPQTAESDLGVPYVLKPEKKVIQIRKRNTVKEVYDQIEKDIKEGIPLIKNDYKIPAFHFTKEAAKAFAARFYLYKGEWDKVIEYTSEILTDPASLIRDWAVEYDALNADELQIKYGSAEEKANLLVTSSGSWHGRNYYRYRYGYSEKINLLLFQRNTNPLGNPWMYQIFTIGGTGYLVPKFEEYFYYTNLNAQIGLGYDNIVLLTYDEVLLNRAEAYVMTSQFAKALEDIEIFLSKKTGNYDAVVGMLTDKEIMERYTSEDYTPFYPLTPQQGAYVECIAEMRRREFIHEGMRWFDIKRFHIKVTHQYNDKSEIVLEKDDPRKVLQIPPLAVDYGTEPNPN